MRASPLLSMWDLFSFAIVIGALLVGKGKVDFLMLEHADHMDRAEFTGSIHSSFGTPASKHGVIRGQVWTLVREVRAKSRSLGSNNTCWLMWEKSSNKTLSTFGYFQFGCTGKPCTGVGLLIPVDPVSRCHHNYHHHRINIIIVIIIIIMTFKGSVRMCWAGTLSKWPFPWSIPVILQEQKTPEQ